MSIDFKDETGAPIKVIDFDEAISVVRKFAVIGITQFPPEYAVQIPNILRCLEQGRGLTAVVEERLKK